MFHEKYRSKNRVLNYYVRVSHSKNIKIKFVMFIYKMF